MSDQDWKKAIGEQRQLPLTNAKVEMPKVKPAKDSNQSQNNSQSDNQSGN